MDYNKIFIKKEDIWQLNEKEERFFTKTFEDEIAMCKDPLIVIPGHVLRLAISKIANNQWNPYAYTMRRNTYSFYGENIPIEILENDDIDTDLVFPRLLVFDKANEDEFKVFYLNI